MGPSSTAMTLIEALDDLINNLNRLEPDRRRITTGLADRLVEDAAVANARDREPASSAPSRAGQARPCSRTSGTQSAS